MPQPSTYFRFVDPAFRTSSGHYQIAHQGYGINDSLSDIDDGHGDNLSQIGDITSDTFSFVSDGSESTNYSYVGHASDGGVILDRGGKVYLLTNTDHINYSYVPDDDGGHFNITYDNFALTSNAPYDLTAPACYATGTRIATAGGETAVEALQIGDRVLTASGALRPIKWIGTRGYSARFLRNNPDLLPIVFKAGCLADNVPARDLLVSPKHAMFLDGVLIAAEELINGVTILRAQSMDELTYWHIELDSHDVLLAEGAPSESFVDDDSRGMFHNAATFAELYDEDRKDAVYCAPRVVEGHTLHAVRQRLAERAGLPVLLAA